MPANINHFGNAVTDGANMFARCLRIQVRILSGPGALLQVVISIT